jgi:hypothetical protein
MDNHTPAAYPGDLAAIVERADTEDPAAQDALFATL